jgi:hypothetical protein
MTHSGRDCTCVRCCALRVELRQMAIREERAGRERAWLEARPRSGPRPGTVPAIEAHYGPHRAGPRS